MRDPDVAPLDVDALVDAARASAPRPVVLVDGRSGAGKTSLARLLAPRLGAQLVSLDDVYPGWGGLAIGSAAVPRMLAAVDPGWRRWDWAAERAGEWHPIDPELPLVVEGCGALSRASRPLASLALWLDLDPDERRRRALARDGDAYAPHWERWAAQEDAHLAAENPRGLADLLLPMAE